MRVEKICVLMLIFFLLRFYCEVDDTMKVSEGGGIHSEDIRVVYLPVEKLSEIIFDESIEKPAGFIAACLWFIQNKLPYINM